MFEAEVKRRGITYKEIWSALNIDAKTLRNKRQGFTELTLSEALYIRDTFFPDLAIEVLFDTYQEV